MQVKQGTVGAHRFVQPDYSCDPPPPEVVTVVIWNKGLEAVIDTRNV